MKLHSIPELIITHIEDQTTLLGPYKRFVIWVYGCCFDCDGCLNHGTNHKLRRTIPICEVVELFLKSDAEGLTISGGEPLLQAEALYLLISEIRRKKEIGVIAYTGFILNEICNSKKYIPFLSTIDILIDGQYIKELDDGRAYVGSSNQIIHYMTDRYVEIGKKYYSTYIRKAEIKFTADKAILIGVPSTKVLEAWQNLIST